MAKKLSKKSAKKSVATGAAQQQKPERKRWHRSFRRSYREDYIRPFEGPGLLSHAVKTFQVIFKNWRLFLPLVLVIIVLNILLVGLMNEDTYVQFQKTLDETNSSFASGKELGTFARSGLLLISTITTGGLSQGMSDVQRVFAVLLFLITWLVVIYILRHTMAKQKIKLRDALYNALSPLLSTFIVLAVIFVQAIPAMVVVITYSAAVRTNFLSTPFYALIYFIFAALLLLLSIYLISSSLVALVAVSAPGLYPMMAINTASDLLAGRRVKFIIRLLYLVFVVAVIWVVVMLPLIALDLWLKSFLTGLAGIPFVSFELLFMTCFTVIYITTYVYLYYRRLLDYEDD
ncbi:hypothetical protein J6Z37_00630 [Candidatus Saccharibacteria bacterium]|nr:hypothetical protein [Candidatus Saccharibacteria bacterium]